MRYIIKIYLKKKIFPFATIEVDDRKYFDELYEKINECYNGLELSKKYVSFYQAIFEAKKFNYATLTIK